MFSKNRLLQMRHKSSEIKFRREPCVQVLLCHNVFKNRLLQMRRNMSVRRTGLVIYYRNEFKVTCVEANIHFYKKSTRVYVITKSQSH